LLGVAVATKDVLSSVPSWFLYFRMLPTQKGSSTCSGCSSWSCQ